MIATPHAEAPARWVGPEEGDTLEFLSPEGRWIPGAEVREVYLDTQDSGSLLEKPKRRSGSLWLSQCTIMGRRGKRS